MFVILATKLQVYYISIFTYIILFVQQNIVNFFKTLSGHFAIMQSDVHATVTTCGVKPS